MFECALIFLLFEGIRNLKKKNYISNKQTQFFYPNLPVMKSLIQQVSDFEHVPDEGKI